MEQVGQAPKPKNDYTPGNMVRIGGSYYRVTGIKPAPKKGEARIVELVSPDLSRSYEWQPFRGLRVIGGEPKRIRKRRPKAASKAKARVAKAAPGIPADRPQAIERMSLWRKVARVFRRQ